MTAQKFNLDNVGLSVQHAISFIEMMEESIEDDDLHGRALLDAALKELEAIRGEIDKAVDCGPAPADVPVTSVSQGLH